jgi:hypothetical protein
VTDGELVTWLRAQLDRIEAIARAASEPYPYRDDQTIGAPAGGCHWQWVMGDNWEPTNVDPAIDDTVGGPDQYGCDVNLATAEKWESERWGIPLTYTNGIAEVGDQSRWQHHVLGMPATAATGIVEMRSTWALHIVTHDPAAVLADVAAKRAILDAFVEAEHEADKDDCDFEASNYASGLSEAVALLALAYAHLPGYREEWRP